MKPFIREPEKPKIRTNSIKGRKKICIPNDGSGGNVGECGELELEEEEDEVGE